MVASKWGRLTAYHLIMVVYSCKGKVNPFSNKIG